MNKQKGCCWKTEEKVLYRMKGVLSMLYDIVNSTPLQIFFIFLSVVWFISFFFYFYYKKQEWKLKKRAKRNSEQISNYNKIASWIFFWNVVLAIFIVPFWLEVWSTNSMREKYAWSISEKSRKTIGVFLDDESEERIAESETDRKLHQEWIEEQNEEEKINQDVIDQNRIEKYQWETQNIFSMNTDEYIVPQEEMQDKSSEVQKDKRTFEDAVGTENSSLTLEKCRKGYNAGIRVIKYYHTSENVFQIAVLAENAYKFSSENGTEAERLNDLAVAVEYFEYFTRFDKMDPGDGEIISKGEIAFRIGKLLYQEADTLSKINYQQNKQTASHLLLYAFECFKYAVEGVEENDEHYVLYLYYEGLGAFKLVNYIEDSAVQKTLCGEVYNQFDAVSKETIDTLPKRYFENMDKNEFWEVKSFLKNQM